MTSIDFSRLERKHGMYRKKQPLFETFARIGLRFRQGRGVWLVTENGEHYLDFTSGIAVNALGHAHPTLVTVLQKQAEKLWHISNVFDNPLQINFAKRLCTACFADQVFFTNSGAEAIECAIKTARRCHYVNGFPNRYRILTFKGAFHGRTLATLAASGQEKYLEGCGPCAKGFDQVAFDDKEAVLSAVGEKTAALLIEPIQGEGGVRVVLPEILRFLRNLCNERGILLIFDEVQSGMGRTGKLFASEWAGVTPDIMGLAKGIGGGFPLGACLATFEAAKGMTPGSHGSTFGGNPLAMAVGSAVLDILLADGFLDHVQRMGSMLKQGMHNLVDRYPNVISGIEGKGLLVGFKSVLPNSEVIGAMREEKLLTVGAGCNVIRILPPLTICEEELFEGLQRMEKAFFYLSCKSVNGRLVKQP